MIDTKELREMISLGAKIKQFEVYEIIDALESAQAKLKVAEDAVAQAVSDGNVLSTWTALKLALKKIREA